MNHFPGFYLLPHQTAARKGNVIKVWREIYPNHPIIVPRDWLVLFANQVP
jgi:hypothetical protein